MTGCRKKPRMGLISQTMDKYLARERKWKATSFISVTYDSDTRSELRMGMVSAVSAAYMNSIAKKKNTKRMIIHKLFDGG